MKRKCTMEMKRNVKLPKKKKVAKIYEKKMCNGNKKICKITEKTL